MYNLEKNGEAQVRSDLTITDKRLAWIDFNEQTISFVESDIPISVLRDIVNNWEANLKALEIK